MINIPILNAGQYGLVADRPVEQIPLNAWTGVKNFRFRDGAAEKFLGHSESYATPLNAPYWLLPVNTGPAQFWLYPGLAKVGATDGSSHADITRAAGGDYSTDPDIGWTGTVFEGLAVISNGVDVPQLWSPPLLATDLVALTNFPASTTCRSIRSLKRYLIALDVTKSGVRFPFMVKWSHQAPAGGIPASWNEADPTVDAGEHTLPADGGFVVDAHPIRDYQIIYKEYQTWLMQFVGGGEVFRFSKVFDSFGSFNRRCAAEFFSGRQLVFTGDDLVLHDSQQSRSIADGRVRSLIRGQIDSTFFARSFLAVNYARQEVWVCIPAPGNSFPNVGLVWSWKDDTIGLRDLPLAAFIAAGVIDPVDASETWAGAVGTWATDSAPWGDRSFDPSQRAMLMAVPGETKLHLLDSTNQFNGSNMTAYVERVGLGFPLKKDQPPDFETVKQLQAVWPHISGQDGQTINVYVGSQETIDGAVAWDTARSFVIGTTKFVDCAKVGRLHALKFESTGAFDWKLHGYSVDIQAIGGR